MAYPPINDQMEVEDEDDWLEPPTQGGALDPLVNQEFNRISNKFSDAGYREGITDGKLHTLQKGFDEGFANSVPLSRRVGILRGKSAALLAIVTASASASISPAASSSDLKSTSIPHSKNDLIEEIRELIKRLSSLKRDNILPRDEERIKHEQEEHGEGYEFELDQNDKRDMEVLEDTLELLGGTGANKHPEDDEKHQANEEDGEVIVQRLGEKLNELEKMVLRR